MLYREKNDTQPIWESVLTQVKTLFFTTFFDNLGETLVVLNSEKIGQGLLDRD